MREYSLALRLVSKLHDLERRMRPGFRYALGVRSRIRCRVRDNKKHRTPFGVLCFLEAPPRFELGVEVLQTFALPLGHGAVQLGTGNASLFRILFKSRIVRYCF